MQTYLKPYYHCLQRLPMLRHWSHHPGNPTRSKHRLLCDRLRATVAEDICVGDGRFCGGGVVQSLVALIQECSEGFFRGRRRCSFKPVNKTSLFLLEELYRYIYTWIDCIDPRIKLVNVSIVYS